MSGKTTWTPEQLDALRRLWPTATPLRDIIAATGHAAGGLHGKATRLGLVRGTVRAGTARLGPPAPPASPPAPATVPIPSVIAPTSLTTDLETALASIRQVVATVATAGSQERDRLLALTQSQATLIATYQAMLGDAPGLAPALADPAGLATRLTRAYNTITSLEADKANLTAQFETVQADLAAVATERNGLTTRVEIAESSLSAMRADRDSYRTAADLLATERDGLAAELAATTRERDRLRARPAASPATASPSLALAGVNPADLTRLRVMLAVLQHALSDDRAARALGLRPHQVRPAINAEVAIAVAEVDSGLTTLPPPTRTPGPFVVRAHPADPDAIGDPNGAHDLAPTSGDANT